MLCCLPSFDLRKLLMFVKVISCSVVVIKGNNLKARISVLYLTMGYSIDG